MTLPMQLLTPNLRLERTNIEHAPRLWDSIQASMPELKAWMSWAGDPRYEQTEEFTKQCPWLWDNQFSFSFTIFHQDLEAGTVGFNRYAALNASAEIGYWLRTDLAGRGLMTEAAGAVVEFGFAFLNLHRIELHAGLENKGSIRVAEKLGFSREGVIRDGSRNAEDFYDCYVYGLLATDPRPTPSG
jgi:ribosomal-protein-serine acetyltransferase